MPLYDYRCHRCGEIFEVRQKFADPLADRTRILRRRTGADDFGSGAAVQGNRLVRDGLRQERQIAFYDWCELRKPKAKANPRSDDRKARARARASRRASPKANPPPPLFPQREVAGTPSGAGRTGFQRSPFACRPPSAATCRQCGSRGLAEHVRDCVRNSYLSMVQQRSLPEACARRVRRRSGASDRFRPATLAN